MTRLVNAVVWGLLAAAATITSFAVLGGARVGSGFFMLGLGLVLLSAVFAMLPWARGRPGPFE